MSSVHEEDASPVSEVEEAKTDAADTSDCGCGHEHTHAHGHAHEHAHGHSRRVAPTFKRAVPKVGRNDPCPCGSGKKHKRCCLGKLPS